MPLLDNPQENNREPQDESDGEYQDALDRERETLLGNGDYCNYGN